MPCVPPRDTLNRLDAQIRRGWERLSTLRENAATAIRVRLRIRRVRAPGESAPRGGFAAYYDYSDTLPVDLVPSDYRNGAFTLGDAFDVRHGHRGRLAIPSTLMRQHVAILGPRLHETRRQLLVPWITAALELDWSVLVIDLDGRMSELVGVEIVESSLGRSASRTRLDPSRPLESAAWNWLDETETSSIESTLDALIGLGGTAGFTARDARVLRGALELVRDGTIAPEVASIMEFLASPAAFREGAARDRHTDGGARLHELAGLPPGSFTRVVDGTRRVIRRVDRPLQRLSGRPAFRVNDLQDQSELMVAVARRRDGIPASTRAALLVSVLVEKALLRRSAQRRVLVVIEDVRLLLDRAKLTELLAVGAESGVSFVLCARSTGLPGGAMNAALNRCGTTVTVSGSSPLTARFASERIARHGHSLGLFEIMRPPFVGRVATVDSPAMADRPFLVDLSAQM